MKPTDKEIHDMFDKLWGAIDGHARCVVVRALLTCLVSVAADGVASRAELDARIGDLARELQTPTSCPLPGPTLTTREPAHTSDQTGDYSMTNVSRTPTAKELTAARRAQAPTPAPAPQVPATQAPARAVVPATPENYRQRYLDEVAPSSIAGRLIKFKEGSYITTDDEKEVPEGAEFILLADDTLIGWIKFNGEGEPPERVMGLLFDDFVMPPVESLPDRDKSKWELGLDGEPADPWQHQQCIVLQETETAELFTFSTSSKTGRRAVGNLLRHFTRMQKTHPDQLPVIRLGKSGFEHKDKRVGFVDTPVFVVCGRAPRDSAAKPDTSIGTYLNDKIEV